MALATAFGRRFTILGANGSQRRGRSASRVVDGICKKSLHTFGRLLRIVRYNKQCAVWNVCPAAGVVTAFGELFCSDAKYKSMCSLVLFLSPHNLEG